MLRNSVFFVYLAKKQVRFSRNIRYALLFACFSRFFVEKKGSSCLYVPEKEEGKKRKQGARRGEWNFFSSRFSCGSDRTSNVVGFNDLAFFFLRFFVKAGKFDFYERHRTLFSPYPRTPARNLSILYLIVEKFSASLVRVALRFFLFVDDNKRTARSFIYLTIYLCRWFLGNSRIHVVR